MEANIDLGVYPEIQTAVPIGIPVFVSLETVTKYDLQGVLTEAKITKVTKFSSPTTRIPS